MSRGARQFYEFGPFRLDATERRLLREGVVVPLTPKVFDTLMVLVENSGHILTKVEMMKAVWADSNVEEANLTKNISTLRKALDETSATHQYIETIPWRGYRFVASVKEVQGAADIVVEERSTTRVLIEQENDTNITAAGPLPDVQRQPAPDPVSGVAGDRRLYLGALAVCAATIIAIASYILLLIAGKGETPIDSAPVRRIAILPFKSLSPEAGDDYLGLGMADTLIIRLSSIKQIIVRPTSAVRRYVNADADALSAGRELQVDSVLDGTFAHIGDRLRVSVNLLRVQDGASLWAEKFDERFTDIFEIQDKMSQQVAVRMRQELDPVEQARLSKRYTSNPDAYNYYARAMYHFSNIGPNRRTRTESELAVDLFKRAIDLDSNYAMAHAQLGYAYARTAVFLDDNPALVEEAKHELGVAETLDPQLAEVHAARYFIAFSQYEGWQVETAIREVRLAQQLNRNVGHWELADLYAHIGLEKEASEQIEIGLNVDPNNEQLTNGHVGWFFLSARPDEGLEANRRFFNRGPDMRYYLEKRMVNEAAPLVEQAYQKDPGSAEAVTSRALLLALQGRLQQAKEAIPVILKHTRRNRGYHHLTYNIARIYALAGMSGEAVKWLGVTVNEGFPCYPLFARDSFLDSIRKSPEFVKFMSEMKTRQAYYEQLEGRTY